MNNLIVNGEITVFGEIGDSFMGVSAVSVSDLANSLAEIGPGPLTVRLNSPGGVATDGMAIYSLLKAHNGPVTTIIDGIAASAASLVFMAGEQRLMRKGSVLMIHEVSGLTIGDAADHAHTGAVLDKMSSAYAGVYADATGLPASTVREAMQSETWMDSDDAVAQNYATGIVDDQEALAMAAFDYSLFVKAPANVMQFSRKLPAKSPAKANLVAPPLQCHPIKEIKMDPNNVINAAPAAPLKTWAIDFYAVAEKSGLNLAETNAIVAASATLDAAKDALIEHKFTASSHLPHRAGGHITVGAEARDKASTGITEAVLARGGIGQVDRKSEFFGFGPMDIVRHVLATNNIRAGVDPRRMVAAAITQTGSDFPNIVSNIATKSLLLGYDEVAETFQLWTGTGDLPDFKTARAIDLNAIQSLKPKLEGQEYQYLSTGDRGEAYAVTTAGGIYNLTREVIINDDLDVFVRLPQRLGRAAKRTIGDAVYGALALNAAMSDGNPLFSAPHYNTASGASSALSSTSLQTADLAMGTQKDRSNPKATLGIVPKYLITPRALKYSARQIIQSTTALGQSNPGVINPVQNLVAELISEPRLDVQSATAWYMAADQMVTDTLNVVYLRGQKQPMMELEDSFSVDGLQWKIRLDFGVKAFGWEGLYKSAGA